MVALLGDTLVSASGECRTEDVLVGKQAVALYFSAHWCPPCRGFTPKFAEWYSQSLKAKGLEVIFCSSDKDEAAFKEYFGEMPWHALPYANRELKEKLSKQYKVNGIPSVVVLDADGKVITKDGRSAISSDPTGEEFPWKPKSLKEILSGAKLLGDGGKELGVEVIENKVFAFYFSAHWCPPCRGFTPQLAEWYSKSLKAKGLEVVFVSSDRDEGSFNEYFKEMPWFALDYSDRKRKEQLSTLLGVSGIPALVIIDKDGSVVTTEGRSAISSDPEGDDLPWYPKPVADVKDGPGRLQEIPTVIAFCETNEPAAQQAIVEAMTPVAQRFIDEQKASGDEDPKFGFMVATKSGGIASRLRELMLLPALPPAKHEHSLEKKEAGQGWGCDGCGKGGPDVERHRCSQGCDWDFCGECNAKAGSQAAEQPRLMIIDIPSDGAFYEGPGGEITGDALQKLLAGYEAQTLKKNQLKQG